MLAGRMPSPPMLKLLTWNIGRVHLGGRINRIFRHDSRAHDGALDHVARTIRETEAHVVALQELASRSQMEQLLERLGPEWSGCMGPDAGGDRAVAVLAWAQAGAAQLATVALGGGRNAEVVQGPGWLAMGVHFDAFRPRVRKQQAEGLVRFLESRDESVLIVAGDLNIDLRYPLHATPSDRRFMRALTRTFRDLGRGKGYTVMGRRRLDYVLVRGSGTADLKVLRRRRVPLGDHDPLLARIALTTEPALAQPVSS